MTTAYQTFSMATMTADVREIIAAVHDVDDHRYDEPTDELTQLFHRIHRKHGAAVLGVLVGIALMCDELSDE